MDEQGPFHNPGKKQKMEPVRADWWRDYMWTQPDGTMRLLFGPNQKTEFATPERGAMDTPGSFASSSSSPKKSVQAPPKKPAREIIVLSSSESPKRKPESVRGLIPSYEKYRKELAFEEEEMTEEDFRKKYAENSPRVAKYIASVPEFRARVLNVIRETTGMNAADAEITLGRLLLVWVHLWDMDEGVDRQAVSSAVNILFPPDMAELEDNPFADELRQRLANLLFPKSKKSKPTVVEIVSSSEEEQPEAPPAPVIQEDGDDDDDDDEGDEPRAPAAVSKRRGVVKTADGAVKRYLEEYAGGNITALKKRIQETFDVSGYKANEIATALKTWLTTVWFAQEPNRDAPSIADVMNAIVEEEATPTKWNQVLHYEERVPKKRAAAKSVLGSVQPGRFKLRLRIAVPSESGSMKSFVELGLLNWDARQPLAFVSDIGGLEGAMTTMLNSQIPESLGITLEQLRLVQPYMLGKAWTKTASLLEHGSLYGGTARNTLNIIEFERQSDQTISFLPLQAKRKTTGVWTDFSADWPIEEFRENSFNLPEQSKLKGELLTVPFRSQNALAYRIVFVLYYRDPERIYKFRPMLVGVYIYMK